MQLFHQCSRWASYVSISAWTDIVAISLKGGQTVYSTFRVSLSKEEQLCVMTNKQIASADYICFIDALILDEASIIYELVLQAINALIKKFCHSPLP